MSETSDQIGPVLALGLKAEAVEIMFVGDSYPMLKFSDDDVQLLTEVAPISLSELREALGKIEGVTLGIESDHVGWYSHEGQKFDLNIYHEADRTGASFKHVKDLKSPPIESVVEGIVIDPSTLPTFLQPLSARDI